MTYTEQEIQATVAKLLRSEVRYPTDPTSGVRRTDTSFTDLQESAAGLLVMEPSGVFYVTYLAARSLVASVRALKDKISSMREDFSSLRRTPIKPLSNLTALADASSALLRMETVAKTSVPKNLSTVSTYDLFELKIDEFLADVRPHIVLNGKIVNSAENTRASLPPSVATLNEDLVVLTTKVQHLHGALDNYAALKLPSVLSSNVLSRARRLVANRHTELAEATLDEREKDLRQVALDLLSTKGVILQLGGFSSPSMVLPFQGKAKATASVDRPATPARLETYENRFDILPGANTLLFKVDGGPDISVDLPVASSEILIRGSIAEPISIKGAGPAQISTSKGPFSFSGVTQLKLTLKSGVNVGEILVGFADGAHSAADIAAILNDAISWDILFSGKFEAITASNHMVIRSTTNGAQQMITVVDGSANLALGLRDFESATGQDASNILRINTGYEIDISLTIGTRTAEDIVTEINATLVSTPSITARARTVSTYPLPGVEAKVVEVYSTSSSSFATLEVTGVRSSLGMHGKVEKKGGLLTVNTLEGVLRAHPELSLAVDITAIVEPSGKRLAVASKSVLSDSFLVVGGPASSQIFPSDIGVGRTRWFKLDPDFIVKEGSLLQTRLSNGQIVQEEIVTASDGALVQFTLLWPLGAELLFAPAALWFTFSDAAASYFDRLKSTLGAGWLSFDYDPILRELTRYANVALANKNPSQAVISTVVALLQNLEDQVTPLLLVLEAYKIPRSLAIENLIRDYSEKGADRALDTLLECRFSDFFGLTVDQSSYSGNLLAGVRVLAQKDFPVDRRGRFRGGEERLYAEMQDSDPEFEFDNVQVDPGQYVSDEVGSPDSL